MDEPDGVAGFFGPGGRLAASFVGYEPRSEQQQLADAVERALGSGENLLVEAGTGVGKSLGYLVPALESGQRVVVSTATKALQEQLLTKDVPIAAAALGRELKVAVVKGRNNYLCLKALDGLALLGSALLPRPEDARAYERMLPWIETTQTGDRTSSTSSRLRACGASSPWAPTAAPGAAARMPPAASPRARAPAPRTPM